MVPEFESKRIDPDARNMESVGGVSYALRVPNPCDLPVPSPSDKTFKGVIEREERDRDRKLDEYRGRTYTNNPSSAKGGINLKELPLDERRADLPGESTLW